MMATMRPLRARDPEGEWADAHMGGQAMMVAPQALVYGNIIRGPQWAFLPRGLPPKNLVTGQPTPNG